MFVSTHVGCLTCKRHSARVRGVCGHCYNTHRKAIAAGKTTWGKLEAAGKAIKPLSRGARWMHRWKPGAFARVTE